MKKQLFLITIIILDILGAAETDIIVPSFPELQSYFNLTPSWVEALLSVNFVGYLLSLFYVGHLSDRYGRKPVILVGLITFVIGSIVCRWAETYNILLAGRFLQGIGVAAPAVLCFVIIADTYPLKKQQSLMAVLNGLVNVAVGTAPVVGSYISIYFHWQGNFMVLLILGLISLIMTISFIPNAKKPPKHKSVSTLGVFKSKTMMLMVVNIVFGFLVYWIFIGISPLLYMKDLGVSLSQFGFYQGVLALVFSIGSIISGSIISRFDHRKLLNISSKTYTLSLLFIAWVTFIDSHNPLLITLAVLSFIVSSIIPGAIIFPLCLNYMPKIKGKVSAILQGGRLILAVLGLQLAGHFYQGSFQSTGVILTIVILVVVITHVLITRSNELNN